MHRSEEMDPIDPRLHAAYDSCRRMQLRHDPTYYWATRRLPADVRPAVHALYGFVRTADEIVDGPRRPPDPAARRAALDRLEDELRGGRERGTHPAVVALLDAGRRHRLPLSELSVYMRSMRRDCGPVRIADWDELVGYMQGSAGSVGRIMAPLLGAPPERHESFARLGLAFQLTNFIRDVREDLSLDRVYLPAEDRHRHGVRVQDIAARRVTPAFRALVAEQVARARALFADGEPGGAAVAPQMRRGIALARAVYLGVLDRVEAIGFDVLRRRASLPPWALAGAVANGLRGGP